MELTLDSIRSIRLYQRKRGYRFSLDALLLFDFARQPQAKKIADLGAGSGIIGLLLAKEKHPHAEAALIELQEQLSSLAEKNILLNGLEERVRAVNADMRDIKKTSGLKKGGFDLVVSNPPFRKPASGRISVDEERALARHELRMSLHDLVEAAGYLLKHGGKFCLIYHPERLPEVLERLRANGPFEAKRLRFVHGKAGLKAKMVLIEAVKGAAPGLEVAPPLVIYDENGSYTPEVKKIYGL
ncbi:MAG: tRNA1(Val) (adenine(37)-N6)-methyltransferase [Nitrospiraceae bacterium]|nr:tRNA1(Val) (adenine(37)-N6)-methyltransferase [Nitrospiraceae bacterium]